MTQHSITTLENLSNIKAHTLRIWEKRYQVLKPKRSNSNIRYYDDFQLVKLLRIATLLQNGFRISKISKLSNEELITAVTAIENKKTKDNGFKYAIINRLLSSSLTYDIVGFEVGFEKAKAQFNSMEVFLNIVHPLLLRLGLMWSKKKITSVQEHFLSNLIRQKILASIDEIPSTANGKERWLLFLPSNEYHDIVILCIYFLLKQQNKLILYLGHNTPISGIDAIAKGFKPTHSLFFIHKKIKIPALQEYIKSLDSTLSNSDIYFSGTPSTLTHLTFDQRFTHLEQSSIFQHIITNNFSQ